MSWGKFQPRKWQAEALPKIIEALRAGKKPIVSAIMGAGKSVLIAELCYRSQTKLAKNNVVVVSAPRQTLVRQLSKTLRERGLRVGEFWAGQKDTNKPVIVACTASLLELARILDRQGKGVAMLVVDEVHSSEAEQFKVSYERMQPACAVGFTATPFRSNESERLTLWDTVAYRYSAGDALKDKAIVPWTLKHWDGTGAEATDVDRICMDMIRHNTRMSHPGIVSALDIEDAESYARYLTQNGMPARAIHSRLPAKEQARRIDMLKRSTLWCLVHVSLLAEGVDLPWLRWICLRRPVGAKVRFVQEVGRVLRSAPDKDLALVMDPHNLFGRHGLSSVEAIGEALVAEEPEPEILAVLKKLDKETKQRVLQMPAVEAFSAVESWTTNILTQLQSQGYQTERIDRGQQKYWDESWRGGIPTPKQLKTLENLFWTTRYLPVEARTEFKKLAKSDAARFLKRGTISDMISILRIMADQSQPARSNKMHWHFPSSVRIPSLGTPMQGLIFAMEHN